MGFSEQKTRCSRRVGEEGVGEQKCWEDHGPGNERVMEGPELKRQQTQAATAFPLGKPRKKGGSNQIHVGRGGNEREEIEKNIPTRKNNS